MSYLDSFLPLYYSKRLQVRCSRERWGPTFPFKYVFVLGQQEIKNHHKPNSMQRVHAANQNHLSVLITMLGKVTDHITAGVVLAVFSLE